MMLEKESQEDLESFKSFGDSRGREMRKSKNNEDGDSCSLMMHRFMIEGEHSNYFINSDELREYEIKEVEKKLKNLKL